MKSEAKRKGSEMDRAKVDATVEQVKADAAKGIADGGATQLELIEERDYRDTGKGEGHAAWSATYRLTKGGESRKFAMQVMPDGRLVRTEVQ